MYLFGSVLILILFFQEGRSIIEIVPGTLGVPLDLTYVSVTNRGINVCNWTPPARSGKLNSAPDSSVFREALIDKKLLQEGKCVLRIESLKPKHLGIWQCLVSFSSEIPQYPNFDLTFVNVTKSRVVSQEGQKGQEASNGPPFIISEKHNSTRILTNSVRSKVHIVDFSAKTEPTVGDVQLLTPWDLGSVRRYNLKPDTIRVSFQEMNNSGVIDLMPTSDLFRYIERSRRENSTSIVITKLCFSLQNIYGFERFCFDLEYSSPDPNLTSIKENELNYRKLPTTQMLDINNIPTSSPTVTTVTTMVTTATPDKVTSKRIPTSLSTVTTEVTTEVPVDETTGKKIPTSLSTVTTAVTTEVPVDETTGKKIPTSLSTVTTEVTTEEPVNDVTTGRNIGVDFDISETTDVSDITEVTDDLDLTGVTSFSVTTNSMDTSTVNTQHFSHEPTPVPTLHLSKSTPAIVEATSNTIHIAVSTKPQIIGSKSGLKVGNCKNGQNESNNITVQFEVDYILPTTILWTMLDDNGNYIPVDGGDNFNITHQALSKTLWETTVIPSECKPKLFLKLTVQNNIGTDVFHGILENTNTEISRDKGSSPVKMIVAASVAGGVLLLLLILAAVIFYPARGSYSTQKSYYLCSFRSKI